MAQQNDDRNKRPNSETNQPERKSTTPTEKRAPGEAEELDQDLQQSEQNPAPKTNR